MGWLIILLGILALFVVIKMIPFSSLKYKVLSVLAILLLLFLYSTYGTVITSNHLDMKTPSGVFSSMKLYFSWMGHILGNMKIIVGNAVKMDWVGNSTL